MKKLNIFLTIYFAVCFAPTLQADIFVWTDENGVRNFTNFSPPEKAELFIKTPETLRDTAEDQKRAESESMQKVQEAEKKVALLREELDEVKKRLAESKNETQADAERERFEQSEPSVSTEDYLSDAYRHRSYAAYGYNYPYAGYGYSTKVHSQKKLYHKRLHRRRSHNRYPGLSYHYKNHPSKRQTGHLKKHRYKMYNGKNHRIGQYKKHAHKRHSHRIHLTGHFKRLHK
jgi:hypothetical protein